MEAIGFTGGKSLDDADAFVRFSADVPQPTGHDLRVAVQAVSVNPVDTKVRAGIKTAQQPPRILGWDAAGTVEMVGDKVTRFKPGDEVYTLCSGAFAEFACAPEEKVALKPENLTFEEAAAIPAGALTALLALRSQGKLKEGQKVLGLMEELEDHDDVQSVFSNFDMVDGN